MPDDRAFLGKGWRFPVAINLTGGISSSSLDENVRESIFIILGTAPGERVNRPTFGCRIHDLMFAPNNYITAAMAESYVEEALYKFEQRLDEVKAVAAPSPSEPNRLDVKITYKIIGQTHIKNLVYPFYLRQPDEEG
ncbi:MAG TPA: GPW/gp25 family protein [Kofleriaceae bacterium]|jgi:phage baseplate assembly protein W|nr:GPW/gp25 family protein [Kofleriaceae bacterium]